MEEAFVFSPVFGSSADAPENTASYFPIITIPSPDELTALYLSDIISNERLQNTKSKYRMRVHQTISPWPKWGNY